MNDVIENFLEELERSEAASNMFFSEYFIPQYYQELNQEESDGN